LVKVKILMLSIVLILFTIFKTSVKKYIWQIGALEGANLICFLSKKQIKLAPSKKTLHLLFA